MDLAQSDIQLETYIFDCTGSGADVARALVHAVQSGRPGLQVLSGRALQPR